MKLSVVFDVFRSHVHNGVQITSLQNVAQPDHSDWISGHCTRKIMAEILMKGGKCPCGDYRFFFSLCKILYSNAGCRHILYADKLGHYDTAYGTTYFTGALACKCQQLNQFIFAIRVRAIAVACKHMQCCGHTIRSGAQMWIFAMITSTR